MYIAQKVEKNSFRIAGGRPGLEVSWQITGIRRDPFAQAYPLVVEVGKSDRERGYYLNPELYGAPQEKRLEWAHYPRQMERMKESK